MFSNLFGRRKPPRTPPQPAPAPRPLALMAAPSYTPVPTNTANPLDADLVAAWLVFQRSAPQPTWAAFHAQLTATNAELDAKIAAVRISLKAYPPNSRLVP